MPPFAGQGFSSGARDVANLAWKLDAVLRGAPEGLLDTYEAERRPVAERIVESGSATEERHRGPLVSAVHGICTQPADGAVGQIDDATAEALGVTGVTVLAVRPDRYIGLRANDDDAGDAVESYLAGLVA
jgi:hypothetical protein